MGRVIGILGDPNTGKSVFTYLLFKEMVKEGYSVFRQEGDPSAPTGPWYLESLRHDLRKKTKSSWDEKKVEWVRDSLKNLRKVFDYVLVDLGGGVPPKERVTRELREILESVDEVILLCPAGREKKCFISWERELKEKAPHVKVILKCTSDLYAERSEFDPETNKCVLVGLDRRLATNPPEHLTEAIHKIKQTLFPKRR